MGQNELPIQTATPCSIKFLSCPKPTFPQRRSTVVKELNARELSRSFRFSANSSRNRSFDVFLSHRIIHPTFRGSPSEEQSIRFVKKLVKGSEKLTNECIKELSASFLAHFQARNNFNFRSKSSREGLMRLSQKKLALYSSVSFECYLANQSRLKTIQSPFLRSALFAIQHDQPIQDKEALKIESENVQFFVNLKKKSFTKTSELETNSIKRISNSFAPRSSIAIMRSRKSNSFLLEGSLRPRHSINQLVPSGSLSKSQVQDEDSLLSFPRKTSGNRRSFMVNSKPEKRKSRNSKELKMMSALAPFKKEDLSQPVNNRTSKFFRLS